MPVITSQDCEQLLTGGALDEEAAGAAAFEFCVEGSRDEGELQQRTLRRPRRVNSVKVVAGLTTLAVSAGAVAMFGLRGTQAPRSIDQKLQVLNEQEVPTSTSGDTPAQKPEANQSKPETPVADDTTFEKKTGEGKAAAVKANSTAKKTDKASEKEDTTTSAEPAAKEVASTAEPKAETTAAPKAEPKAETTAAPKAAPKAETTAAPKAASTAEPKAETTGAPKAAPKAETTAAPKAAPKEEEDSTCSWAGQNCQDTKCCKNPGMQCYKQDDAWSECMPSCNTAPNPTHWNAKTWNCTELGPRAEGEVLACSKPGEDCSKSQCCSAPGLQCFQKTEGWATCKDTCTPGIDLTDMDSHPWSCNKLGPVAKAASSWVSSQCSAPGADCRDTQCCADPDHQCFARDDFWAECKKTCETGPDAMNPDKPWGCDKIGVRTPPAPAAPATDATYIAPWVAKTCSKTGESCAESTCCSEQGMQCYRKNETVAECKAECTPGVDPYADEPGAWSCKAVGPRTPGKAASAPHKKVASWVQEVCAKKDTSCLSSSCCRDAGMQCYAKNEDWATCLMDCEPGKNRSQYGDIDEKPWSCKQLGGRTPRDWGTPSLFCFAVIRTVGYEAALIQDQMSKSAGIFACDEYAVFSNTPYTGRGTTYWHPDDEPEQPLVSMYLGIGPLGPVHTIPFKPTYVGQSMDHTAGNTELFLHVWKKVQEDGQYAHADWTLKVDPDAVLLVPRMRNILKAHTGTSTYIVNCDKPGMAPMMFGSVEVFSKQAMITFFEKEQDCLGGLDWKVWGEDYFMGKCLDMLGVKRTNEFSMVADGVCKGVDCSNPYAAAFHPKKDSASWMACFEQASKIPAKDPTTPPPPQWR